MTTMISRNSIWKNRSTTCTASSICNSRT